MNMKFSKNQIVSSLLTPELTEEMGFGISNSGTESSDFWH